MKKTIPFTKEIDLKTVIYKITTISLEHTLKPGDNNELSGHFIIDGKYKMTAASQIDEEFSYKIPVDIEIDSKYDLSDISLDIDEFSYELIDNSKIKLDIVLIIDNLKEKEDIIESIQFDEREDVDDLFLETTEEQSLEIPSNDEIENNNDSYENNKSINSNNCDKNSLFSSFKDDIETFKTYSVYIVKEEDTLNSILQKYNIDKELLEEYNDLSNISIGNKIIIPSVNNE